jgi:hypothetical protein
MKRQRKRHPLDVPTPVAVALADFCRRAGGTVEPRTVRDALSLLPPAADARVTAFCAEPPPARPLGPFAVIDVLEGALEPAEAAQRQGAGAYDDVQVVAEGELPPAEPAPQTQPDPEPPAPPLLAPKRSRARKETVAQRIAPVKRPASAPKPAPAPPPEPKPSLWRKRDLPKGRGRFTNVDSTRARADAMLKPQLKDELEALVAQHGHRVALRKALEPRFQSKGGAELSLADVESALSHHGLRAALEAKERELLVAAITDAKGDRGRAALMLGMRISELDHVALDCGAEAEIARVREHWARESLAHGNLRLKLELLDKPKYLADLGVEKRFRDALARELTELFDAALGSAHDLDTLTWEAGRRSGLPYDKLKRALDQTGLSTEYRARLAS